MSGEQMAVSLGQGFALCYERSDKLLAGMVLHWCKNRTSTFSSGKAQDHHLLPLQVEA